MPKKINLTGKVFGRLTVLSENGRLHNRPAWLCRCECGTEIVTRSNSLTSGYTKSCGCFNKDRLKEAHTTHGMTGTSTRNSWKKMLDRCNNSRNKQYADYGGRGIAVCDRWLKFENFLEDMGEKPMPEHQIDRKDNNLGYYKGNCHWATRTVNMRNSRISRWWFCDGVRYESLPHAAKMIGISQGAIQKRIKTNKPGYSSQLKYESTGV